MRERARESNHDEILSNQIIQFESLTNEPLFETTSTQMKIDLLDSRDSFGKELDAILNRNKNQFD